MENKSIGHSFNPKKLPEEDDEKINLVLKNMIKKTRKNIMTIYNLKECTNRLLKEMENNALISPPSK